jgi:hypothetical protein
MAESSAWPERSAGIRNGGRTSLRGAARAASARSRELEVRVWQLLSAGKTPTAISREIGIARQSVHRIIRRVERFYHATVMNTVDEQRQRQGYRLNAVVEKALAAFSRSTQPAKRVKHIVGNGTDLTVTELRTRHGDARHLAQARKGLADLRKLYGLDRTAEA